MLFEEKDIYATSWPLDQLLRELCVKNHITEAYFNERYKIYALQELGKLPTQASNDRSNTVKAIKNGYITYKRLIEVAQHVLGLNVMRMQFVFQPYIYFVTKRRASIQESYELLQVGKKTGTVTRVRETC